MKTWTPRTFLKLGDWIDGERAPILYSEIGDDGGAYRDDPFVNIGTYTLPPPDPMTSLALDRVVDAFNAYNDQENARWRRITEADAEQPSIGTDVKGGGAPSK